MEKTAVKHQIDKVLDSLTKEKLQDVLSYLKNIQQPNSTTIANSLVLEKILSEDKELLAKLAK